MSKLMELKKHLKRGQVYRRIDLTKWSKSVDRHLDELLEDGTLQKLSHGLYYYPKVTVFGVAPPDEDQLVRSFLNDDRFLLTSPNAYNSLGVGTTQLYNTRIVYNHKRHGEFKLGNRVFNFKMKPHFPKQLTTEFLLVDLVNNLDTLAEDKHLIMDNVLAKAKVMDVEKLSKSVSQYGTIKAKKVFASVSST
ncbi:DUF6088 family protein [Pedobacter gandavensis]|uniref:DUF6088 family protein n=1 Tax=Pedobacter gandavensis TaxID=2679963 RepID=UPI00292F3C89|nr:DUF6088 family protein [Pedobacter gandavensis]